MEGGFRLYSEEDVRRVEQIKRLQSLLGFSLAEIKEMVEAEEVIQQIRTEYRRDADLEERKLRMECLIEVTEKQYNLIRQKLDQLAALGRELEEKLSRYHGWLAQLEATRKANSGQQ